MSIKSSNRKLAEQKILEIVEDDSQWNLFVQQVINREGIDLREHDNPRRRVKTDEVFRTTLEWLYLHDSLAHICDSCDLNPKQRIGKRRFALKEAFYCNHKKTQGDVFAEYTEVIDRNGDEEELSKLLDEYNSGNINVQALLEKTKVISGRLEEEVFGAPLYKHNDARWSKVYRELSHVVIEGHTDRTKPPEWLDNEKNLCPNYYFDLTRP